MWDEGEVLLKLIFPGVEFIVYNFKDDLFKKSLCSILFEREHLGDL